MSYTHLHHLKIKGRVEADKFITKDGTSNDFVKGDGSLDNTEYAEKSYVDDEFAKKSTTVIGVGALGGGGDLTEDREIDLTQETKDDIAKGVTAHGWGNHADEGYATEEFVGNAIDDIEIGGRNYLLGTSEEWKSGTITNYNIYPFGGGSSSPTITDVEEGESYVFSARVRFNNQRGRLHVRFFNETGSQVDNIYSEIIDSEDEGRLYLAFTVPENAVSFVLAIRREFNDGSTIVDYKKAKLEIGNKPTDWTPAPEDHVTDWNETNPDSYSFLKNKPTIPTVNNGQLTLSTGTGLTGSATFTANQSGDSSFSVAVASTHKLPTTAEWSALSTQTLSSSTSNKIVSNTVQRAALTGDVTASQNSNETTLKQTIKDDIALGVGASVAIPNKADKTTNIVAGTGLAGGGDLSEDRNLRIGTGVVPLTTRRLNSSDDLDDITVAGYYDHTQGSRPANTPINSAGYLETYNTGNFIKQNWSQRSGYRNFTRTRDSTGGVWRDWVEFWHTGNLEDPATETWVNSQGFITTDTTYNAGTLALLNAGTNTENRVWGAKPIADYVKQYAATNLGLQGVTDIGNWTENEIDFKISGNDIFTITPGMTNSDASNASGDKPAIYSRNKGFLFVDGNPTSNSSVSTADYIPYPFGLISNTAVWGNSFTIGSDFGFNLGYRGPGNISNSNPFVNIILDTQDHHLERLDGRTVSSNQFITQRLHFPPEDGTLATREWVENHNLGYPGTDKDMLFGDGTMREWIGDVNSDDSIALGKQSKATGAYSAAFRGAATGNFSYAFGGGASGIHSISIGNASGARNPYGIAIGSNAEVEVNNHPTYDGGIAIGGSAKSRGTNSIALGRGAVALSHNYMKIGGDTPSDRIDHIKFTGQTLEFGRDDVASRFYMYSADGQKWQVGITTNGTLSIAPV